MAKDSSKRNDQGGDSIQPCAVQIPPSPPDGGWGWLVCLSAFYCNFLIMGLQTSSGILYIGMRDTFQESASITSLPGSLYSGLNMLIGPFVSGLLSFYSHRCVIITGALVATIGIFACSLVSNVGMLIITYGIIAGTSLGMVLLSANVIVGMYFEKKRALAFGIANCGGGVGMFVLNYGTKQLLEHYALKGTFIIISGLALNAVVFGALCRPVHYFFKRNPELNNKSAPAKKELQGIDSHFSKEELKEFEKNPRISCQIHESHTTSTPSIDPIPYSVQKERSSQWTHIRATCASFFDFSVLKKPDVLLISVVYFCWSVNLNVVIYFPIFTLSVGFSKDKAALLVSVSGIISTVSQLVTGALVDFAHIPAHYLLTLSMCTLAVCTCGLVLFKTFWSITVVLIIWSIAFGFTISLRMIVTMDLTGQRDFTRGYSILLLLNGLGYAIGPPIFGWLFDITQSFPVVFITTGACMALAVVLALFINYRIKRKLCRNYQL